MSEVPLSGGVANPGAVVRVGDTVRRPAQPNAAAIHELLRRVRNAGFDGVPEPLGFDDMGREILSFIPGDIPFSPFPDWFRAREGLASVGALLRRYHDAVAALDPPPSGPWPDEMLDPQSGPIVCHNDVCPENVVFRDGVAVALIDFDFAGPGRPLWDAATAARMCVPVGDPDSFLGEPPGLDPVERLSWFATGYGVPPTDADLFVELIVRSAEVGERFVRRHVDAGDPGFVQMWARGYGEMADRRREWIVAHRRDLVDAIAGGSA